MISIVIPAYNAEATLGRCLDTILAQTYPDFEALVVDDGSSDRTLTIAEAYAAKDSRIKPLHKDNGGVSSARNLALSKAKGEYIAFCDADDEVKPDWLKDFIDIIGDTDIAVQDIVFIGTAGNSRIHSLHIHKDIHTRETLLEAIHEAGLVGYLVTKLFRRELITKHQLSFNETIHFREDEIFVLQYMEHVKSVAYVPKANYIYYLPPEKKAYKSTFTEATDDIFRSLNKIYDDKIPESICRKQAWCVKGACIDRLLAGERLSEELIAVYRQVFVETLKREENPMLSWIITNSNNLGKVSNLLIRLIHKIKN